jgi:hypothetical protein
MTIGLILECSPAGPDKKVCEALVKQIRPDTDVVSITLEGKHNLISDCGATAAELLKVGCDCVIIIWDLYPAWGIHRSEPCLKKDRDAIQESLSEALVTSSRVHLVCIHKMLESWLLADERAISAALSKITKKTINVPRVRRSEDPKKPKNVLRQMFGTHARRPYQAHIHAEAIVKEVKDFKRLNKCGSFLYFRAKLAAC